MRSLRQPVGGFALPVAGRGFALPVAGWGFARSSSFDRMTLSWYSSYPYSSIWAIREDSWFSHRRTLRQEGVPMRCVLMLCLAAALLVPCAASADISPYISYQGVMRDDVGNVVPDGDYVTVFAIYDTATGGTALWAESQTVSTTDGIFNVHLGSVEPLTPLAFDASYWLGISIDGGAELTPRTELTSAPYAQRARYADAADDGDWTEDADNIYRVIGNVGIGLTDPVAKLDVEGTARVTGFQLTTAPTTGHVLTSDETGIGSWQPPGELTLPYSGVVTDSSDAFSVSNMGSGTTFRGHAGGTGEAAFFSIGNVASSAAVLHTYTDGTGPALFSHAAGGGKAGHFDGDVYVAGGAVGIGVPNPAAGLEIDGPAKMTGFQLTAAPVAGYVLTSDGTGVGTWEPAAGTIGGAGTTDYVPKFTGTSTIGNSAIRDSSGHVSIGTAPTDATVTIHSADSEPALAITDTLASSSHGVLDVECTGDMSMDDVVLRLKAPQSSSGGSFIDCMVIREAGCSEKFDVNLDGDIYAAGSLTIHGDQEKIINVSSTHGSNDARVIQAVYAPGGGGAFDAVGVYGESKPQDYYGTGGHFEGGFMGAYGYVEATGSDLYYGIYGRCTGGSGSNHGVQGVAGGSGTNYGVYGTASGAGTNWAGYFLGNVRVTGTLVNPGPELEIDHPLDPADRYLRHPAVHSSEMKNVYDGVVLLDSAGEAVVEMPDWFEALNQDFRYQLTAIGAPGPNLYVADEVAANRFRIAGGEPGMKVSWMLTGVRHDAHAVANRVEVESQKRADERGRYLDPEAHSAAPSLAIGRHVVEREKLK
jgi:hypothetical protein